MAPDPELPYGAMNSEERLRAEADARAVLRAGCEHLIQDVSSPLERLIDAGSVADRAALGRAIWDHVTAMPQLDSMDVSLEIIRNLSEAPESRHWRDYAEVLLFGTLHHALGPRLAAYLREHSPSPRRRRRPPKP
jgi:hypothetical protein